MTLEEAIMLNRELISTGNYDVEPKFTKAINLGIEAIRTVIDIQECHSVPHIGLLPGQTNE